MIKKILFIIIIVFVCCFCEKKEGVYFERTNEWVDSTTYIYNYQVYTSGEIVYEEAINKRIKINKIDNMVDSLQEIHKDKFDYLYIKYN